MPNAQLPDFAALNPGSLARVSVARADLNRKRKPAVSTTSTSSGPRCGHAPDRLSWRQGAHPQEETLTDRTFDRRDVVRLMATAGAAGVAAHTMAATAAQAAGAATYNPAATFAVAVKGVESRRNAQGRQLMARVSQPKGPGPFPAVLDLHGGAWNAKDRTAEEPMDRALAASGLLVVAIDMTLAPQAPYPACVQDANYGVRWLKSKAASWNGDASRLGLYGSSSGGHVAELLGMRPHDPRYNAIPLHRAPHGGATLAWIATRSPISNTFARYENAENRHRDSMIKNNKTFFVPWETIHESNPQEILEREEKVTLLPLLVMQGALDDNVLPEAQEKFVKTYKAAGGNVEFHIFADSEHEWVAKEGPQTDKARATV